MVSEPDTGRCASLLAVPRRRVDTRLCASKDAGHTRLCAVRMLGPKRGRLSGRCASLLAVPRRRVDTRLCASKMLGTRGYVPVRMLGPKRGRFGDGPTSIGGTKEC